MPLLFVVCSIILLRPDVSILNNVLRVLLVEDSPAERHKMVKYIETLDDIALIDFLRHIFH